MTTFTCQSFALQPFGPNHPHPAIAIEGQVFRRGTVLTMTYLVSGTLNDLSLPPVSPQPQRRDQLWETTCFEFFWA
ncbi:MAG: hypothetical protein HC934_09600 [Acaryochloridaceae cyanobacterium SU_2_1]|nr:hypothetical protein [Acaryochloridaceae cyanobacterium SU_2_1]NJM95456.1 hypothetical protein [Acaryochloridaceae cyanobacterium CSU_5_19]